MWRELVASQVPEADEFNFETGTPAKDDRAAATNVFRSSKPRGPFGSMRISVSESAVTRVLPVVNECCWPHATAANAVSSSANAVRCIVTPKIHVQLYS